MNDLHIKRFGIIAIIIGIIILYLIVNDDFEDGYFLYEEDRVYLSVNVTKINNGSEFNYFEGISCREIKGFVDQEIKEKKYVMKGDLYKGRFYVKSLS
ncbi:MAG: hypothetical protein ACMXX6_01085 [Candidatus Woesearchaeota archaeon]